MPYYIETMNKPDEGWIRDKEPYKTLSEAIDDAHYLDPHFPWRIENEHGYVIFKGPTPEDVWEADKE